MRIAIAENDTIINVIEAASLEVAGGLFPDAEVFDADANPASPGWVKQQGGTWAAPVDNQNLDQRITSAPSDLFGGPSLKEIFDGN